MSRQAFDDAIEALDQALSARGKVSVVHRVRRAVVALRKVLVVLRDEHYGSG